MTEVMPPSDLTKQELAQWWQNQLRKEGLNRIELLTDNERVCPHCGDINPCTGTDYCSSCGASLKKSKRLKKSSRFDPSQY